MRQLDLFIFDEMIEQYARFNPPPDTETNNPTIQEQMTSEMLVSLLTELKALRPRCLLYETRIVHLNRELQKLMIENADLKRELEKVALQKSTGLIGKVITYEYKKPVKHPEWQKRTGRVLKLSKDNNAILVVDPAAKTMEDTHSANCKWLTWIRVSEVEITEVLDESNNGKIEG